MMFHIFVATMLLVQAWVEKPRARAWYGSVYGALIALETFVLFYTATRGAILGLVFGAILAAILMLILSPNSRIAWRTGVAVFGVILVLAAGWMSRGAFTESTIEPIRRLATMSFSESTIASRFMNIGMALQGVKERPLLGWGQENYAGVFDKYYDPGMYAQEQWFDRTHNVIMDWLVAGGVLGLLGYLALWVTALIALWRSEAFESYERSIISGLLAGYFFYNLFTFDNITSYILFFSLLAFIVSRASKDTPVLLASRALPRPSLPVLSAGAGVLAVVLMWGLNARAYEVNRTLILAITPQSSPEKNLEYFTEAVSRPSIGLQEAREQVGQAALASRNRTDIPDDVKRRFAELATDELRKQSEDAPYSARAPLFLGLVFETYGLPNEAKIALDEARTRSPRKQSILFQSGQNAFNRGARQEAIGYFRDAYELAPKFEEARVLYAVAAVLAGDDSLVRRLVREQMEQGGTFDRRIAGALASQKKFSLLAELSQQYLEKKPEDPQVRMMHAIALFAAGDSTNALRALDEAVRAIPASAGDFTAVAEQMRAGTFKLE